MENLDQANDNAQLDASDDAPAQLPSELDTLKARADLLGIAYHPSISAAKLREKIKAKTTDTDGDGVNDLDQAKTEKAKESEHAKRVRLIRDATKLVRCRISCMNPAKKEWEGEIFSVANASVPTIKRYVPFNAEDGWHVEQMLLDMIKARQCQIFVTKTVKIAGHEQKVRESKLIKEFVVEILDPLTPQELKELAQRQAMAAGGGN